jgi:plastocyanin
MSAPRPLRSIVAGAAALALAAGVACAAPVVTPAPASPPPQVAATVPPTAIPPTAIPPTAIPPTVVPTALPPTPTPVPQVTQVIVEGFTYNPRRPTIKAGSIVEWKGEDGVGHTVTSKIDGLFHYSVGRGDLVRFQFNEPGAYEYYCDYHRSMIAHIDVIP